MLKIGNVILKSQLLRIKNGTQQEISSTRSLLPWQDSFHHRWKADSGWCQCTSIVSFISIPRIFTLERKLMCCHCLIWFYSRPIKMMKVGSIIKTLVLYGCNYLSYMEPHPLLFPPQGTLLWHFVQPLALRRKTKGSNTGSSSCVGLSGPMCWLFK